MKTPINKVFVTFETITDESSQNVEVASSGFLDSDGIQTQDRIHVTLREALSLLDEIDSSEPLQCDSCPCSVPRWITVFGRYAQGEQESRSLHLAHLSDSSSRRIARLLKPDGFKE